MSLFAAEEIAINFGGIKAVDGVSFAIEKGEVFTIIGPNGAGKTTIFNLMSRIYDPTGGRLMFEGQDITRVPPHRIANYVRQHVAADKVETGPVKTVFSRATVRGQPGVELAIQVTSRGNSTELQVRNLSLVKPTSGQSEEERWRAAGLRPDGTPLDVTHLH